MGIRRASRPCETESRTPSIGHGVFDRHPLGVGLELDQEIEDRFVRLEVVGQRLEEIIPGVPRLLEGGGSEFTPRGLAPNLTALGPIRYGDMLQYGRRSEPWILWKSLIPRTANAWRG